VTFWIGVACADHVRTGVAGGFAQLGHGKHAAVKGLRCGDWIAYYSPTTRLGGGEAVRAFTAIGRVTSEEPYQVAQGPGFHPWRVDVAYAAETRPAPIRPLLDHLDLTRGRGSSWGMALRGGRARASDADLKAIAEAMGATIA
jgi:hypothetical protein